MLVHGAWHGAWCWDKVVPYLHAGGHSAVAVELAGHGQDRTRPEQITLQTYVEQVCEAVLASPEPVVLVGHSHGGIVVTQVGELFPHSVGSLIYVNGFLPGNGESLIDWAGRDCESLVTPNTFLSRDGVTLSVRRKMVREAFYSGCSAEAAEWATSLLVPEPVLSFKTPVATSDNNFGRIPRLYVSCTRDRTVPPALQAAMLEKTPCRVALMDCDHSPFLSAPQELAGILCSATGDCLTA